MSSIIWEDEFKLEDVVKPIQEADDSIDALIGEIINYYVTKKPELINDTEKGEIPFNALEKEIEEYIDKKEIDLGNITKEEVYRNVYNYLYKYYILQDLLDDDDITDVKVAGPDNISVKKIIGGQAIREEINNIAFKNKESFITFCNYIARRNKAEINNKNAIKVITDKNRCESSILRINLTAEVINSSEMPFLTIRKIPKNKYLFDDLVRLGMLSEEMKEYFIEKIAAGAQILICGEGGSGKTTFMNAAIEEIDENMHALFIQESEELFSKRKNIFFERIKIKTSETDTEYNLQQITRNSMIQDMNVIGIGEIKGGEAFDWFNAMYSGHVGWGSLHSPSAKEALKKALQYIEYAGVKLSKKDQMEMLSRLDIVIFAKDFKLLETIEVGGYDEEKDKVVYNTVFEFDFKKENFKRLNNTCERLQKKVDYANYKRRCREDVKKNKCNEVIAV